MPILTRISTIKSLLYRGWIWEVFCILVASACLLTTLSLFWKYNGTQLATWSGSITLNTIVVALGICAKAALLFVISRAIGQLKWIQFSTLSKVRLYDFEIFDEASRGPLGAIRLVTRRPRLELTTLGALLMLLMLGFDALLQQSLGTTTDQMREEGTAFIKHTEYYNTGWLLEKDAIYDAVFQTALAYVDFSCNTSLCDFHQYTSLTLCSQCMDVTDTIQTHCSNSTSSSYSSTTCNYTIPGGPSMSNSTGTVLNSTTLNTADDTITKNVTTDVVTSNTAAHVANITVLTRDYSSSSEAKPNATQCQFYVCAQKYNATILNNTLYENEISTRYSVTYKTSDFVDYGNENITLIIPGSELDSGEDKILNVTPSALTSLGEFFADVLTFQYPDYRPNSDDIIGANINSQAFSGDGDNNITRVLTRVAKFVGHSIRTQHYDSAPNGATISQVTTYKVEYRWLSGPLVVVVLTIILFISTVIASKKADVPPWKLSALATMFHGLDHSIGIEVTDDVMAMEARAEHIRVKLRERRVTGTRRLVRVDNDDSLWADSSGMQDSTASSKTSLLRLNANEVSRSSQHSRAESIISLPSPGFGHGYGGSSANDIQPLTSYNRDGN
ncbi:hypothetical protein H2198_000600 [Neophaeococcomyces mojaviensis]|uniref:Uncharacterized protein n=1 Tax=Neophaeococcomyces mojaviensis TaxID=3383035 RepID=A0ACC3AJX4_9EURO|nr:hypothetical protein H2198_000600 [Knufia sp. JES_112]